jgi:DNA-binding GntR family transcriptional regulator
MTRAAHGSVLLRDGVYDALRREILSCELAPGSELREHALAARFSVSKSPVREALLQLAREQLVEVVSRQGYRVTPISLTDARNMYSFRVVLESACAIEAAQRASDKDLRALDEFRVCRRSDAFISYNQDFHCALFEASQNRRMARVACELIEQMDRVTRISINAMREHNPSRLVQEHCKIIDALQTRDGRRAAKLLRVHVSYASKRVLKALERAAVKD